MSTTAFPRSSHSMDADAELAVLAITKVVRAANEGDLPLFAATLGMPTWEFSTFHDERSWRLSRFSPFRANLMAKWLPEHICKMGQ